MKVDYKQFPEIPPKCQLNSKPGRPGEYPEFSSREAKKA